MAQLTGILRTRINIIFNLVGHHTLVNKASYEIESMIANNFWLYFDRKLKVKTLRHNYDFEVVHNTNRIITTSNEDVIINCCDTMNPEDLRKLNKSISYLTNMNWYPVVFYIDTNKKNSNTYLRSLETNYLLNHIYNIDHSDDVKKNNIHLFLR
jgi:hypothetical protein